MELEGQSLNSYSKVDEQKEKAHRRKTRKRLSIIAISVVVLVLIVGVISGALVVKSKDKNPSSSSPSSSSQSIKAMCNVTRYPDTCYSSMSSALVSSSSNNSNQNPDDPIELFRLSLQVALDELIKLTFLPQIVLSSPKYSNETKVPLVKSSLYDCEALFSDAVDQVNQSMAALQVGQGDKTMFLISKIDDLRTWLSTALTDLDTCLEGVSTTGKQLILTNDMSYSMLNSTEYTSNSLAIATNVLTIIWNLQTPIHRKLLTAKDHDRGHELHSGFPGWVRSRERRLLFEDNLNPDLTVAKDGSGNFTTIRQALDSIPRKNESRFVVYVKEGVYVENITLGRDCWNIMMFGDGMTKSIVTNDLNKLDGLTTFSSGTFIAWGRGFLARDMGFRNSAGPQKSQAVALRSSSDRSVFYRCSFDAYQHTLYVHSNNQFYRDCLVTGTVDFIFGNAAVVFQNCTIQPRQPMLGQFDTITAHGKFDLNQNTGISIHRCWLTPLDNLTAPAYLGRPWRNHSTTVIAESFIGEFLSPLGWTQWQSVVPPNTTFYAEYRNYGPGSATDKRVAWPGVWPNLTKEQAQRFTVEPFIHGSQWIPKPLVPFNSTL